MRSFSLLVSLCLTVPSIAEERSLFDGKSLAGWEGNTKLWRVENGLITGGSLTENVQHNDFLATEKSYRNFELKLKIKVTGAGGFINSGIQIRSTRVPNSSEMCGYQIDAGVGWWGKIYDESRRNKVIANPLDEPTLLAAVKATDWNEYRILAEGPRIRVWINGVAATDFTETDPNITQEGHIGIQVHGGGKALVQVKDVTIHELPTAPPFIGAPNPPKPTKPSPLTPEEEKATFTLPPGFEIELVAAEEDGIGKFIAVCFDHAGRMWTMTALEYPVDANEHKAEAEALFAKGGRDKILIYDKIDGPGPHKGRVWAENLAMPLGLLPHENGAYIQYGRDIRFYEDTDGDGKADRFDVILTGFGIDDSHLFPHQFTRGPGGWIYLAQGAFNHGNVKRPDGQKLATGGLFSPGPVEQTRFSFCKLARMRPDGSDFQIVSSGPNNIWGFHITLDGDFFIQEANDLGYPVVKFELGTHLPGIGNEQLKPYAPFIPPTMPQPVMGGTGLSGLAIKEGGGWPKEYTGESGAEIFYLANPITNRLQAVRNTSAPGGVEFSVEKLADFMLSSDPWFRPIAMEFGPDGSLYVVDWYNKVISHNEVPRKDPNRDKTRGRIWRIKHKDQPKTNVRDLTKLSDSDLEALRGNGSAWERRVAYLELQNRGKTKDHWVASGSKAKDWLDQAEEAPNWSDAKIAAELDAPLRPMGQGPWAEYRKKFESYRLLGTLEKIEQINGRVGKFLTSPEAVKTKNLALALQALDAKTAAPRLAALALQLDSVPGDDLLVKLAENVDDAQVSGALKQLATKPGVVDALLNLRNKFDSTKLAAIVTEPAQKLWDGSAADKIKAARIAGAFKLGAMQEKLIQALSEKDGALQDAALEALTELKVGDPGGIIEFLAQTPDAGKQSAAIKALAASSNPAGARAVLSFWPKLAPAAHAGAVQALASSKTGAAALVAGIKTGVIAKDVLDAPLLDRLTALLDPAEPALKELHASMGDMFRPVLSLDGKNDGFVNSNITLDGPFTVECWVRLAPGIGNEDSILGSPNQLDINFYDGKFRVWVGPPHHDVIISTKTIAPDTWTHVAVTRDAQGKFRLYHNGELDTDQSAADSRKKENAKVGWSGVAKGTSGQFSEFRVWNKVRTAEEIRANFDRSLTKADGLVASLTGDNWGNLNGSAKITYTMDFPPVVTEEQAKALDAKFAAFKASAQKQGDAAKGKIYFQAVCGQCHQTGGQGVQLGPPLDGSAHRDVDSVLRALLTPDAAVESGYRLYRVQTKSGELSEGFLVNQDAHSVTLRFLGGTEKRFNLADVAKAGYTNRSIMSLMFPAAFEGLPPESVSDLFEHLRTLK